MEPIRVLHNIVLMDAGGIETLVMNLYRHIDKEQILFDFLVHRPQEGYYEKEIREYGGKVYRTRPFNPLHMREYKKECMNILTSHPEYKVFHVHQELGLWTLDYAHQAGIPTRIAHAHNAKT
ncbi:MAG TPA: glycosyltransferase family 1 protein, partial [Ruminococcus bromii]|nr:glycosyltransferase family 1 protein [Ruminococcus bromii]